MSHFADYQQARREAVDRELVRPLADSELKLADSAVHTPHGKPARSIRQLCSELSADLLVMGIPSHSYRETLSIAAPFVRPWVPVLSLTKGLEQGTRLRMSQVTNEVLPGHRYNICVHITLELPPI